jgi:hypothetical protein
MNSRAFLLSLEIGDVITAPHHGYDELLEVVRDWKSCTRKRERASILIKRPHLKASYTMTEEDENNVGFLWSCRVGKEYCDFRNWKVSKKTSV